MTISFQHSIRVPQSPHEVFVLLDDTTKVPLWLKRCEGVAKVGGGPHKVGDKLRYAYNEGGHRGVMDGVIVAFEPDRRLSYKYFDKTMQVCVDLVMEPDGSGTRLKHLIDITPNSIMARLMAPLFRMKLPKQTRQTMENIRELLASER